MSARRGAGLRAYGPRAALVAAAVVLMIGLPPPGRGAPAPAGTTAAVLSMIDASAGRVEVVRHWPWEAVDVDVYPFVPYFWDGCPGPGAVMVLVTGPPGTPLEPAGLARALGAHLPSDRSARESLVRIIDGLRTPGDPDAEALKAASPWVSDLATYEREGYAVFLFIHWQGVRCAVTLRAVPEGYGIPFVR